MIGDRGLHHKLFVIVPPPRPRGLRLEIPSDLLRLLSGLRLPPSGLSSARDLVARIAERLTSVSESNADRVQETAR